MPKCGKCGGEKSIMESKPGKGGRVIHFVGCPSCFKNKKAPEQKEKKGDPPPKPKEEEQKKGSWLDDWL